MLNGIFHLRIRKYSINLFLLTLSLKVLTRHATLMLPRLAMKRMPISCADWMLCSSCTPLG